MWRKTSTSFIIVSHKSFRNLESTDLPLYSVKGHKEIINCIDGVGGLGIGEGAPEIVTGSRDGIKLIYIQIMVNLHTNHGISLYCCEVIRLWKY